MAHRTRLGSRDSARPVAILREKARGWDIFALSRERAGAEPPPLEFFIL